MKKLARYLVVSILGWQVRQLRRKHNFKVVGVAGSVGKTSSKFAIATVLRQKFRVRWQAGNYNDLVTVPLIFFGEPEPSLYNPLAWLMVFWRNQQQIRSSYPFDVVVVEVGTDYPGNIIKFAKYLSCDLAVVTAVSPEHMEFFSSLDEVAHEELSVGQFSKQLIVNSDLIDKKYLESDKQLTFGHQKADYQILNLSFKQESAKFDLVKQGQAWLSTEMTAVAISELYSATAAAVVADQLGVDKTTIAKGIVAIKPVEGRMQRLKGIKKSLILDESYNASPEAVKAALDSLYEFDATGQKMAILGNMNELGKVSPEAHKEIGEYCDPQQLDLVVTIGPDANKYLAPAAEEQGCRVKSFTKPQAAGKFVKEFIEPNAVILVKGSQNNVYAEEAIKLLLDDPADATKLVRQSPAWLKKKQENFK